VLDEMVVDVDQRIPVVDFDPALYWCPGDIITLDASQSFSAEYGWSTGAVSASIEVNVPGTYTVDVVTPCRTVSESVDVVLSPDCVAPDVHNDIFIPNVFSPNGDNINDYFRPAFGSDVTVIDLEGTIYDRWGNLVFQSVGQTFSWDGFYAGERLLPGAYVYVLHIVYFDGTRERDKRFAGDITLVR
jgi:gliding motility-associated-like protein